MVSTYYGWNDEQRCRPVIDVDNAAVVAKGIEISGQQDKGCLQLVFLGREGVEDGCAQ